MTGGFTWTPRLDSELRRLRADGVSLKQIANVLCCHVEHVRQRAADLALMPARVAADVGRVPRPVSRPAPGKIDLSAARSTMEERFSKGADR